MEELIKFMDQWQTLFGAFVGGVFALCVALLVAYKARRQEDLSAGMILVGNLVSIRAAHKSLMEVAKEEGVSDNDIGPWLAEKLVWSRPKLSPLFGSCVARIMPLGAEMAAHLDLFHTIYSGVEHHLDRLHQDFEQIRKNGKSIRSTEAMKADASLVKKGFFIAAAHANCAETLVTETVLSNFPTVHCLRRRISPSKEVKECKGLLTKGSF